MHFNAIGTLSCESHGDGHQFLVLLWDNAIGKCSLVPGMESSHCLWSEFPYSGQLIEIIFRVHGFCFLSVAASPAAFAPCFGTDLVDIKVSALLRLSHLWIRHLSY